MEQMLTLYKSENQSNEGFTWIGLTNSNKRQKDTLLLIPYSSFDYYLCLLDKRLVRDYIIDMRNRNEVMIKNDEIDQFIESIKQSLAPSNNLYIWNKLREIKDKK